MVDDQAPGAAEARGKLDGKSMGLGAAGGAGVSTVLFTTLGIRDLLAKPQTQSLAFPIVVFSLVALLVLVAALFTIRVDRGQRAIVWTAMAGFLVVALGGTGFLIVSEADQRPVTFNAHFDPEWVVGEGRAWASTAEPRLQMQYRAGGGSIANYAPWNSDIVSVAKGQTLNIRVQGIQQLLDRYERMAQANAEDALTRQRYCKTDPGMVCVIADNRTR